MGDFFFVGSTDGGDLMFPFFNVILLVAGTPGVIIEGRNLMI